MSQRPWYKRYAADFLAATLHMTAEQKGAYSVLIDLIYDRGGPIADDAQWLARVTGCSTRRWNQIRTYLIADGKIFATEDGRLSNRRCERQIENEAKEAEKFRINGAKGGEKTAENLRGSGDFNGLASKGLAGTEQHRGRVPSPEKEDTLLRNGATAPDAKPTQTTFLPPVPPTPLDVLYADGLPIVAKLTGKSPDEIRSSLGGLAKIAGPEFALEVIRDCENAPPKGSLYAWIKRCCDNEAKRRGGPVLVVDNDPNDPWGIRAWCRTLPSVKQNTDPDDLKSGQFTYQGWIVDYFAREIAIACRFPASARIDWRLLGEWLAAGYAGSNIVKTVRNRVGNVDSVGTLAFFDQAVRQTPIEEKKGAA